MIFARLCWRRYGGIWELELKVMDTRANVIWSKLQCVQSPRTLMCLTGPGERNYPGRTESHGSLTGLAQ